ncbi:MAG: phage tail protein [Chloroflexi bacterium]|nr:phage tail protein [Chloroflexota bacterium]
MTKLVDRTKGPVTETIQGDLTVVGRIINPGLSKDEAQIAANQIAILKNASEVSTWAKTLLDDVDASAGLGTLGFSAWAKTLIDDADAATARATLGVPSGVPPGAILPFGGTTAPTGYLMCDGTSYLRANYVDLFAAIGTAYGSADGTHFNVPDARGQVFRVRDAGAGVDPDAATRTALKPGGNTGDNVGSKQLTATKLPSTPFTMTTGDDSPDHTHTINVRFGTGAANLIYVDVAYDNFSTFTSSGASARHTHTAASWGGGDSESRMPNIYVNAIIKT